jgi:hypothetical protein
VLCAGSVNLHLVEVHFSSSLGLGTLDIEVGTNLGKGFLQNPRLLLSRGKHLLPRQEPCSSSHTRSYSCSSSAATSTAVVEGGGGGGGGGRCLRRANANDQQSIRKQSSTTVTNEWNPTCLPQSPNGCLQLLSSDGSAVIDCCGWILRSEGTSHDRRCEPSSGEKAKMTRKTRARRGTTALAQRRV